MLLWAGLGPVGCRAQPLTVSLKAPHRSLFFGGGAGGGVHPGIWFAFEASEAVGSETRVGWELGAFLFPFHGQLWDFG